MKKLIATVFTILLLAGSISAQPFATGFTAPLEVAFTHQGNLIVAEAGTGPNTGRISLVDRTSRMRRTLIAGLPSGLFQEGGNSQPGGPNGLALQGSTLYVTISGADTVLPGGPPGTQVANPSPASPILSSLLSIRTSKPLDLISGGFTLTPADHAALKGGSEVTLTNAENQELTIDLVVDFPDFIAEPRGDFPANVRQSNSFGVAAVGQTLYVVDASRNLIFEVDANDGEFSVLASFPPVLNPLAPMGPPMIDFVPNSIRVRGNELLVTGLIGFPFPQGRAEVRTVNRTTGSVAPLIGGLTSALDVLPLGGAPTSPMLVLEFSANMLAGQPGRLKLVSPGAEAQTIAEGLITPTGIAVDQRSGEVFITHLGPGFITRINAGNLIPRAKPTSILPVVASAPGAFGSQFTTSAQLTNPHPFSISGRIVVHPRSVTAQSSDPGIDYVLAPFETRSFDNLVGATGGSGVGTADIIAAVGGAPVIVARIIDTGSGTMPAVQIPQLDPASALGPGTRGTLITPSDATGSRFNVGIRTLEGPVSITITHHAGSGAVLRTITRVYPANYFVQLPVSELLGTGVGSSEAIVFSVDSGSAIVYGSTAGNSGQSLTLQVATPASEV